MSETHSEHTEGHGHDEHHGEHGEGHGDSHGGHGAGHGGHGAEHGHGGGHGHGHDEFAQYLHDAPKQATPEQLSALKRIATESAKKLRAKTRVEAVKAIAALQKDHEIQHELGPLIIRLRVEIIKILEKK
ncbi:hypothetical protein IT413_03805 [Candidatus Peregrinibacteria bacterium]|nr:hypothetical protein [Candidatus Peregrinibacteria bacterium]